MSLEFDLYLVATPIGNLEDITYRALRIFREVDCILAEDTRRTGILLQHYGIKKPLISFYEHNKAERTPKILDDIRAGKKFALVSDSGTPGISDPGFYIVRAVIENGFKVSTIPGANSAISALIVSGLPTHSFVFEGFLPNTQIRRQKKLRLLADEKRTIILFESPHRLLALLKDCLEVLGDRRTAVVHELTKKFESVQRGKISELVNYYSTNAVKGEFVVVIEGSLSANSHE